MQILFYSLNNPDNFNSLARKKALPCEKIPASQFLHCIYLHKHFSPAAP